jgi:hypothetical protein
LPRGRTSRNLQRTVAGSSGVFSGSGTGIAGSAVVGARAIAMDFAEDYRGSSEIAGRSRHDGQDGGRWVRRRVLRAALGLAGACAALDFPARAGAAPEEDRGDVAVDDATALLFPDEAPLVPAAGLRDARAVWSRVPPRPDHSALVYLHGHNGYVTVDASGRSRVPDWAAGDAAARAGASAKAAAPLAYKLDRLDAGRDGKTPIVLVPEVSTLAQGSFWAKEPAGQYADPSRLGALLADCLRRLARLHRPNGRAYLPGGFAFDRVYLAGHSGAGLPLEEAAESSLIRPGAGGVPADLWLFDCTYWSRVTGFVRFCSRWNEAGRLAGGRRDASRFVCVYRPRTQTEEVADALRAEVAKALGVAAATLVVDHSPENFDKSVRPALQASGALFVRTHLPHDEIPTVFIPALIGTSAS